MDHPAWWSLPSHASGQPEDPTPYSQGPALEERPIRLERRHRPRAADATHRPRPSRHPSGWTSPQQLRFSRSDAPRPSRAGSTLRWHTRVSSLPMTDAQPEAIAAGIQGHWGIENRLHVGHRRHLRRRPPPATHPQRPTGHGRTTQPGHPASSAWPTAPKPLSPPPPDPCQDALNEPSNY